MRLFTTSYPLRTPAQVGLPVELLDNGELNHPDPIDSTTFDYIIVGGGTAGCVLARRLTDDYPDIRVLLVERGPLVSSKLSSIPLISANINAQSAPKYSLPSRLRPEMEHVPHKSDQAGGKFNLVGGKALGGSTKLNVMLYTRGAPGEWNSWVKEGCEGWAYDDLLPFFKRSEKATGKLTERDFHGTEGEWTTSSHDGFYFPHYAKMVEACETLNLPFIPDANARQNPAYGCAKIDVTVTPSGTRASTDVAFLPLSIATERKDRLSIVTGTIVSRVLFEASGSRNTTSGEGDQKPRAVGVIMELEDDRKTQRRYFAFAKKEIILCAGAVGTPHLLLLSGVGPIQHLREKEVPIIKDLPGVGLNLQDHVGVITQYKIPIADSLDNILVNPLFAVRELFRYLISGKGIFLAPFTQLSVFARSSMLDEDSKTNVSDPALLDANSPDNIPDIEIMPIPINSVPDALGAGWGGLAFLTVITQPKSRGTIRLRSKDARAVADIDLGYFTEPEDWTAMRKALNLAREIGEAVRRVDSGYKMEPVRALKKDASDEELKAFVWSTARTCYHYSSTCRMARLDDPEGPGVVDNELRVYGIDGLRIADASVLHRVIATHTQAPTVVVAERCAEFLKGSRLG